MNHNGDRRDLNFFNNIKRPGGLRHRGGQNFMTNNETQHHVHNQNGVCDENHPHLNCNNRCQDPISGPMGSNTFMLINAFPYLWDNTRFQYGQTVSVADSVFTRVLQRKDPSSINLSAVFDLSSSMDNNVTLNFFLEQIIKNHFHQLNGLIPVIQSSIVYNITYTVCDLSGGVVNRGTISTTNREHRFHRTEIRDYFLLSNTNVTITNIPQIDFHGPYILKLEKITAFVHAIDIQKHVQDFLNPFYQWTDNNQTIHLAHDTITRHKSDMFLPIAEADIDFSTQFDGNLTTRLKISFTSFISNVIMTRNTFNVWRALYDVDGATIRVMKNDITTLKRDVEVLDEDLMAVESRVTNLETNTEAMGEDITKLKETDVAHDDRLKSIEDFNMLGARTFESDEDNLKIMTNVFEDDEEVEELEES